MRVPVSIGLLALSAALTSAQATLNPTTGLFDCSIPDGVFCAGDSLTTNIIIRCVNGIGTPGNCNDNLIGEPPVGDLPTQCFASATVPGEAACVKNCVVFGDSGNINDTFTLPNCTPTFSATTSTSTPVTISIVTPASSTPSPSLSVVVVTTPIIYTTTPIPLITVTPSFAIIPTGTAVGTGGAGGVSSNGTSTSGAAGGAGGSNSTATATPRGPTKTTLATGAATFTGAAATNVAAFGIAAAGLVAAAFL